MSKKRANKRSRKRVPGTVTRRRADHHRMVLVVGDADDSVVAVRYYRELDRRWRSGLMVFTSSAPDDREPVEDDCSSYCLACTLIKHPEASRGVELARAYDYAWWDDVDGSWLAEDEDGNEVLFDAGDEPSDDTPERSTP